MSHPHAIDAHVCCRKVWNLICSHLQYSWIVNNFVGCAWFSCKIRSCSFMTVLCDSSRDSDSSPLFSLWLGIRNRDSGPSHARVQTVAPAYSDIQYILLFVFMFWKINKCWIWGLGRDFFFFNNRTLRWWLGLGLAFDSMDSNTALFYDLS